MLSADILIRIPSLYTQSRESICSSKGDRQVETRPDPESACNYFNAVSSIKTFRRNRYILDIQNDRSTFRILDISVWNLDQS